MSGQEAKKTAQFGIVPGDRDVMGAEDAGDTLGRVRALLFGEAQQAQSARLDGLEAHMAAEIAGLAKQFDARLTEFRRETRAELEALSRRVDTQGNEKIDRADFGSALRDIAQRLGGGDQGSA